MQTVLHLFHKNKNRKSMRRVIISSCAILLAMNLLFAAILSCYGGYAVAVSSFVIVATGGLLYAIDLIKLKDAYKVSLTVLFSVVGCIEFILSLFSPNHLEDNWWLIAVIGLLAVEAIILVITNTVSHKI